MEAKTPKKRMGRPPAGADGERTSDYPKLAVTVKPATRARLNAVAAVENRSSWQIVDDAINQYADRLPVADRRIVDALAKRSEKAGQDSQD